MYSVEYTWEHRETRHTTQNITAASPSTFIPISSRKDPRSKYGIDARYAACPAAICARTTADITSEIDVRPMPTSEPLPGSRLPKKRIRKNESAGSDGISHAYRITGGSPRHHLRRSISSTSILSRLR